MDEVFKIPPKKNKSPKPLSKRDILKMEIAQEMGIWDKVEREGWQSLTNAECGRVGGIMKRRIQEQKQDRLSPAGQNDSDK